MEQNGNVELHGNVQPINIAQNHQEYINYGITLYKACLSGDWKVASTIFHQNENTTTAIITDRGDTVLHIAIAAMHIQFVENLVYLIGERGRTKMLDMKNKAGNTALCLAALYGTVSIARIMIQAYDETESPNTLPTIRGYKDYTPLDLAALAGHGKMVQYLWPLTRRILTDDQLLTLLINTINTELYDEALSILSDTVNADKLPWLAIARDRYQETLLSVLAGKCMESARSQPYSWRRCFNILDYCRCGDHKKRNQQTSAFNLVNKLWNIVLTRQNYANDIENLMGPDWQMLFEAVKIGNIGFLTILINSYPDLIWKFDENNGSIFHVAIQYRQEKIFNLIYEIGAVKDILAIYKDNDCNSMLHYAARLPSSDRLNCISGPALQMQREMLWFKVVKVLMQQQDVDAPNAPIDYDAIERAREAQNMPREGDAIAQNMDDPNLPIANNAVAQITVAPNSAQDNNHDVNLTNVEAPNSPHYDNDMITQNAEASKSHVNNGNPIDIESPNSVQYSSIDFEASRSRQEDNNTEVPNKPQHGGINMEILNLPQNDNENPETPNPPQDNNVNPEAPNPPRNDNENPETPNPPQDNNVNPEAPNPPQNDNENPETPNPPQDNNVNPEAPNPPQDNNVNPEAPNPPQNDNENPETPNPPQDNNVNPEAPNPPQDNNVNPQAPNPPQNEELPRKIGKTAEAIFNEEHENLRREGEKWMRKTATSCSVVATLIAGVAFQVALKDPKEVEGSSVLYWILAISDSISLISSIASIFMFLSILMSTYAKEDFLRSLPLKLVMGLLFLSISIFFMMIAFDASFSMNFTDLTLQIGTFIFSAVPMILLIMLMAPLLTNIFFSTCLCKCNQPFKSQNLLFTHLAYPMDE